MVEVTDTLQQITCSSPDNLDAGRWFLPSGEAIPEGSNPPVFAVYRSFSKNAELHVQGTLREEGIYTCRIPAQNEESLSLYVGLYNSKGEQCACTYCNY